MIRLSLVPGKSPRKYMQDIEHYARSLPRITKALAAVDWRLARADVPPRKKTEILVHLVSDAVMKKLNSTYRHKPKATDVLSFSYLETATPLFAHEPVGEIYVSLDTAVRQAREWNTTLAEELAVLTAHGTLHIMGYDHEKSETEMKKMRRVEKQILVRAGLPVQGLTDR
ncbi:MAG: rRNA maturation RNase YbeY [Spirochaetes bacterium]|nr:rRNA maturation RNase YbeY [Spirochaetota bacterium]